LTISENRLSELHVKQSNIFSLLLTHCCLG